MNSNLKITTINTTEDFLNLREEWNSLLAQSENNNIFLKWEWLYNWWKAYDCDINQLFIITVRNNNQLLGIAPFYDKKESFSTLQ